MRFALVLLSACVPLTTSTTTSTSPSPSPMSAPPAAPAASLAPAPTSQASAPPIVAATSTWFVSYASVTTGPQPAVPVSEGTWLDAAGKPVLDAWGDPWNHAMRTNAATLATIKWGRPIIVSCGSSWYLTATREIDQAAATIGIGNDPEARCPTAIPVSAARVIVEFKDVR